MGKKHRPRLGTGRARTGVLWAAALVAMALPAAQQAPAWAAGPLASNVLAFDSDRPGTGHYEIYLMHTDGSGVTQLTNDATFDSWWPKISPDRTKIVFVRTPSGVHDRDYTQISTWTMNVDGTGVTQILANGANGWGIEGHPEWSPDGTKIATICGPGSNAQICVTDSTGANPHQVTNATEGTGVNPFAQSDPNNRGGFNVDPSWADATHLLFIGCPAFACEASTAEIYRVDTAGTHEDRLTNDNFRDNDPVTSPDGTTIFWEREISPQATVWAIMKMNADGTGQTMVLNDGGTNSVPTFSPDGSTVFFHRMGPGRTRFDVFKMGLDGSNLTELESRPAVGVGAYDNENPQN